MQGNINKQLASLALLLLLLVAVSIPVMATEGDDGAPDATEGYTDGSDGTLTDVTDVPTPDDGGVLTDPYVEDDTVVDDVTTIDDSVSDGTEESGYIPPSVDDELIYATAYGANCQAGACNVNTACEESEPTTTTGTDTAKDTGSCVKKTCAKSTCNKS
jgi:hypothetical protein